MNKRPINKMLELIVERKPELAQSTHYTSIINTLAKSNESISYAEKLKVRDNLRVLCVVSGLSYERLIMRVCK
jgi:hypothetical protein